jgi:hypothetical protein
MRSHGMTDPHSLFALRRLAAASLLVPLIAIACTADEAGEGPAESAPAAAAPIATPAVADGPQIFLREPRDGASVPQSFQVVFGLRNYGVAPAGVKLSNTGHFHILIGVESPAAGEMIPTDSLHRHYGGGQIETTLTLPAGEHTLRLVLADHEHRVLDGLVSPPVRVSVRPRP